MHRRLRSQADFSTRHGWLVPAVYVSCLFFLSSGGFAGEFSAHTRAPFQLDSKQKLALPYLRAANEEFLRGRVESAISNIGKGLEIDPGSSDLLLLRAQLVRAQPGQIRAALADARAALSANRFVEGSSLAALRLLLEVQRSTHAWNDVVRDAEKNFPDTELIKYPELLASKIDALHALGKREQAENLTKAGLSRSPDNAALISVALKYQEFPSAAAFLWFNRYNSNNSDYRSALFWYAYHLQPGAERLQRVTEYLNLKGSDSFAIPLGLQSLQSMGPVSADQEKVWLDKLLGRAGSIDLDAARLMSESLTDAENQARLLGFLKGWNVTGYRDYDRDGRAEEEMRFDGGRILSWRMDSNQDDLAEFDLSFVSGRPARVVQESPGRRVVYEYGSYPEITRFVVQQADVQIEYLIPHRAQELRIIDFPTEPVLDPISALTLLKVALPSIRLDPEFYTEAAWLSRESRGTGVAARVHTQTRWEQGAPIAQSMDSNGDGRSDALYWFDMGIRAMGFRDPEDSGVFSVLELYQKGKLSNVTFVSPSNGYSYAIKPSSTFIQWDLNRDYRIDLREMQIANAWLFDEFTRGETNPPLAQGSR